MPFSALAVGCTTALVFSVVVSVAALFASEGINLIAAR
jgi:hypothetical protein